ncbi:MAG: SLBB domain-containing protein, partial [Pseudomonadota bacterium]
GASLLVGNEDIIYVPPAPVFYVYGEVQKPGAYPLAPNMTVRQALSIGGGLTVRGTERGLRVTRRGSNGELRTVEVGPSDPVKEGAVIRVKESLF